MLYGLDIGGTKIELCALDSATRILTKRIATPTKCYTDFLARIKKLILDTDEEIGCRGTIGIGIPGFIDPDNGKAWCCNVPCTNNKPLQFDLELTLDRPVKIENDANCFTLSEAIGGAADGFQSIFGVILGTGCGGGLYFDEKLYTGRNHLAGEWGHTPLPYNIFELAGNNFPIVSCNCGLKGCLDNYLSGRGLELIYTHLSGELKQAKQITHAYRLNDKHASDAVNIYCNLLASSLGAIINTIDPGIIIFGGGLSNFDELYELIPPLLEKYTIKRGQLPEVRKAFFGDSSGVRGAAMLNDSRQLIPSEHVLK